MRKATARSCSNIAFIKYWGNDNDELRLPSNGSISMNLASLHTTTTITFDPSLGDNEIWIGGKQADMRTRQRVENHLRKIQAICGNSSKVSVISENNFPAGTGIASSASAFAALTAAACDALGLKMGISEMSALARLGSGSAARSIPDGFVEWKCGEDHESSYAYSIASAESWDLADLVAIVSNQHKEVGSTDGHALARTSPFQNARLMDAPRRLDICRQAIQSKDFEALAAIIEQDAYMMHSVMHTSSPSLLYWLPSTLKIMSVVVNLRRAGLPVAFTIDAGPNVHVITMQPYEHEIRRSLEQIPECISVLSSGPGPGVQMDTVHFPRPQVDSP